MMKHLLQTGAAVLALSALLSSPAAAASILTGETFAAGSETKNDWQVDLYEPEEFDFSGGQLYLAVGKSGYAKNRDEAHKDKRYANHGMKLAVEPPSSNTWTATVKINIDDFWFSNNDVRKRAEFRVDLMDKNGNPVKPSPAIAIIKGGTGAPYANFVNPEEKTGWGTSTYFINGDREKESLSIDQGWHTLFIKCSNGVISYSIDEKKIGSAKLEATDIYPTHMALNAQNYNRPYVINFDSCYLYDGAYGIKARSSEQIEAREDRLAEQYAERRESWRKNHPGEKIPDRLYKY